MTTKNYRIFFLIIFLAMLQFIFYISLSQRFEITYLRPIRILECIKTGSNATCSIINITSSDNAYENLGITSNFVSSYGLISITFERFNRYDINLINLSVGIEGIRCRKEGVSIQCNFGTTQLGNNISDRCYFGTRIFQNNRLLNEFPNASSTCTLWRSESDTFVELQIINNITSIREIIESNLSAIWYGYDANDTWVVFKIDFIYVNVTYFNLTYSNWNFYNFSDNSILIEPIKIIRGQNIIAAALFNISDVNITFVTHNGANVFNRYNNKNFPSLFRIANISRFQYWINFTINTSDFNQFRRVGPIFINLTAINKLEGFNTTTTRNFTLYGFSKIGEIRLSDYYVYPSEIVEINCSVIDANLSIPLAKYPINFYANENSIGNSRTEEKGYALLNYKTTEIGDYIIKCNIDDQENLYYYASEEKELSTNLKVLELNANISLIPNLNFGELQVISINVTNASKILYVYANISYKNISNYELVNVSEIRNFTFNKCYEPYICNYNLTFIPPRSGFYNLTIYINAESPNGILIINTNFTVNFGETNISIIFPDFDKILVNQTFLIKLNISAINGDIWNVNISLNSSNYDILNLLENEHKLKLFSIAKEKPLIIEYLVESKNFGKVNISISAISLNGSSSSLTKTFEIIGFDTYISKNVLNFGEKIEYLINIGGNTSDILYVYAKIYFFNISNCKLFPTNVTLNFSLKDFTQNFYSFNLSFIPPRSGNYLTEIFVITKNGTIINKSDEYLVKFGNSEIFVINPFYFVLTNQTFYTTIGIRAIDGDLWYVSTNISILNKIPINLANDENNYHLNSIEAVANGTFCIDKWKTRSQYIFGSELTTMYFYAYPKNGSSSSYVESFEVILPLKPYIYPNISFIDEFAILKVPVFGNSSSFKFNSTIFKPDSVENVSFLTSIPKNYSECGLIIETGNVAPKGMASASINYDSANLTIDNNLETSWNVLDNVFSQLNITLNKITTIEKIEIVWQGPSITNTYVNISYIDASNNVIILATNVLVNSTKTKVTLKKDFPFKTNEIIINISGIILIYELKIIATTPRVDYCYEFYYNFTNFTRSGNYNVSFLAVTEFNDEIYYENSYLFINYGIPLLSISNDTLPIMLSGQTQNYTVIIEAFKGDLKNLNLIFISSDENYINISSDENFEKTIEILPWKGKTYVTYDIVAKIQNEPNITILTYINTSCKYCHKNNSIEFNVTIYPLDIVPPKIEDFWFEIKNKNSTIFNLNDSITIFAKVIDDIFVKKVIVEMIYPNNIILNVSMERGNLWKIEFPKGDIQINQTGNFAIRIYAFDLNETSNVKISDYRNFSIVDIYFIDYEPNFLLYNFGEKIVFIARDINDFIVEDVFWNESNYNISNIITYFEIFLSNETFKDGEIFLNISATKYGNKGIKSVRFNLTKLLHIEILSPPQNYIFDKNTLITGSGLLPSIKVQNARKDKYLKNLYSEIYCFDSNSVFTKFSTSYFYYNACGFLNNMYSFRECLSQCFSPNSSNQIFNISFYVRDDYGNEGFNYVILYTKAEILPRQTIGGFGGSGGAPVTPIKQCKCSVWQDVGCGKGKCALNQMYQIRSCEPTNCETEERCIESILCTPTEIEAIIEEKINLVQGETKLITLTIKNTGKKSAELKIEYNSSCCKVELSENEIKLDVGETKTLTFTIYSYLNESVGEYELEFNIYDISEKKKLISKSIVIILALNQLFIKRDKLMYELKNLDSIIQEYKFYNILSKEMLNLINRNSEIINTLDIYIKNNKVKDFENSINELENNIIKIKDYLENKKINLFFTKYRKEIILSLVITLILSYLISQIILPYLKISKEIQKLIVEEEIILRQRREIQKQFFMRKLSDEIFKKMITDAQNKLLAVRGKIKTLNEEKSKLIKERINPLYIIKLLINLVKKIKK